jgi:hypothetical protein
MDVSTRPRLLGWRGVVLVVVGVALGALAIAPGVGLAAKFLTKQQVKKRYLGNTTVVSQSGTAQDQMATPLTLNCPSGQQATGGGVDSPGTYDQNAGNSSTVAALESRPVNAGGRSVGWYMEVLGATIPSGGTVSYTASVVCSS